jgi:hypothetical protein
MAKQKPQAKESGSGNLLMAVILLTGFAGLSALSSAYIAGYVLDQLQSTDALVMIVTDGGKLKSDSADLERNMSTATLALKSVRDIGWALAVGCLGVGVAVFLRSRRQNVS